MTCSRRRNLERTPLPPEVVRMADATPRADMIRMIERTKQAINKECGAYDHKPTVKGPTRPHGKK